MTKEIVRHVLSTKKLSRQETQEIESVSRFYERNAHPDHPVSVRTEYFVEPNLLDEIMVENRKDGHTDIDENWLYDHTKHRACHSVFLYVTRDEWRSSGIKQSLYGQEQTIEGRVVCYGRWRADRLDRVYKPLKEFGLESDLAVGLAHEESGHGFAEELLPGNNKIAWGHTYFYGYGSLKTKEDERKGKVERFTVDPDPGFLVSKIPWNNLPDALDKAHAEIQTAKFTPDSRGEVIRRDPADMHPVLAERFNLALAEYHQEFGHIAQMKISTTFRNDVAQERMKREGKSRASFGQSLHNFLPCYAVDVYADINGVASWDWIHYQRFGNICKKYGLEWGGDWVGLRDGPHIQIPMTYQQAQRGEVPKLAPLPAKPIDADVADQLANVEKSGLIRLILLLVKLLKTNNK